MFTWICPQCGHEVLPSYSECPNCAENAKRAAQGLPPVGAEPVAAPPQSYAAQPAMPQGQAYPGQPAMPQAPAYAAQPPAQWAQPAQGAQPMMTPAQSAPPTQEWRPMEPMGGAPPVYILPGNEGPKSGGLPGWLMAPGIAVLLIGVIFGAYKLLGGKSDTPAGAPQSQSDSVAEPAGAQGSPYAKFVEVTGVRFSEDDKQSTSAHMVVVNHSSSDLPDLSLRVTLRTTTAKPGDDPVAVVTVNTGTLAANGIKEVSAPLTTKLRAYELPDWQFLRATADIVSPK
jgi:hypothetical protein